MKKVVVLFLIISILFGKPELIRAHIVPEISDKDTISLAPISTWGKIQLQTDKIISSKPFKMTYIGVPLVVAGLIVKNEDYKFRHLRNNYVPNFKYNYDDYLQYAPAAIMVGLKAAGVKSRSSWPRMLVSDAFSVGIMALTVNTIKYSANVLRPDGSNRRSFPSGHTATAFMTATMMHKEYGLTRSPWYSIGGYTLATATAVSRILNNKHWLSDVLVGAGIGILSTELGYYLADLIFKDKGITYDNLDFDSFDYQLNPSFVGLYVGLSLMPTKFPFAPNTQLKASAGSTVGLEGAWFMNRYVGIGGRASASSFPLSLTAPLASSNTSSFVDGLKTDPLNMLAGYVGPYFSYPITNRFLAGAKLLVGCNYIFKNKISTYGLVDGKEYTTELANVKHSISVAYGTGASLSYILKQNLSVRVFFDYNVIPSKFSSSINTPNTKTDNYEMNKTLQTFNLGASVNVMLW